MPIKLNGATNGSVELDVPAAVGSDLQVTLPATAGTAIVKATDGSVDLGSVDIDSSGNLGVGTAAPSSKLHIAETNGNAKLTIQRTNSASNTNDYGSILWKSTGGNNNGLIGVARESGEDNGYMFFSTAVGGSLSERMRITSGGLMQMGDASSAPNGRWSVFISDPGTASQRGRMLFYAKSGANAVNEILQIFIGTTEKLRIRADGNVYNANNTYSSLSDVKLKENIVDAASQWDDIKSLRVRKYNFKEDTGHDTHTQIGLVAQEVETVSPGLVTDLVDNDTDGEQTDTVTKSVNYSVLYMKAVKALQEAMTRIETLETKVAALEATP